MNPILLDTDPGIDDAVAMIVLRRFCPSGVKLILASYGNISIDHTVRNALTMRGLLRWDIPVIRGAEYPCTEAGRAQLIDASYIHGSDGLGGLGLSPPEGDAFRGDAPRKVYDTLLELGRADYLVLGPMTNLRQLLRRFPDAKEHIDRVVCMGGGIEMGNVTPDAEFNILCDPEAARDVFSTMPEIAMVPLNLTTRVSFSMEEISRIAASGGELAHTMGRIMESNYHACIRYGEKGSIMHDSTAALYCLFPELFETKRCGISVDTAPPHRGRTAVTEERRNVTVVLSGDIERIKALISESAQG